MEHPDSVSRLIDANLNRVAEALRAAEDVCRFHWNLRGFAEDLKALRHEVLGVVSGPSAPREAWVAARDIEGDVGRDVASPPRPRTPEGAASALDQVAIRNVQRAKEALRTLSEVFLGHSPATARALELARYRLYALEKGICALTMGSPRKERLRTVRLCLLATSALAREPLVSVVREAIEAGVDMVQLRETSGTDRDVLRIARSLRELTARNGVLFIVNDRPDLAVLCAADGVHVGQDDLPPAEARRIVGPERIVGVSTHGVEQARAAEREGVDYLGAGPVFPTATKDAGPAIGPEGLARIVACTSIPVFAIGGVAPKTAPACAAAGARRLAVSSAVLGTDRPGEAVRELLRALGHDPGGS